MPKKKKIIFLCTQNSARSQMAEGLMGTLFGEEYEVFSAGTNPSIVNPFAIKAMAKEGIDISYHRSKSIDDYLGVKFDWVVTVCDNARENCPFIPYGQKYMHQNFTDPASIKGSDEEVLAEFEKVRDEIKAWLVETFGRVI
ncbi:arsenate reductase [hydrocarbon metagenome]|uniref:Arsenate reductase n=1 Tax=hydrocarbon metagenome TaxID=938273 RepID=A0A0W8E8J1_9ZZZZ